MLGAPRGGAVRLHEGSNTLLLGEGVETTLAALQLARWRFSGWAALSTAGLVTVQVPARFQNVVIAADNDTSGAGLRAARSLARRLRRQGRQARVQAPPTAESDWNDFLRARQAGSPEAS